MRDISNWDYLYMINKIIELDIHIINYIIELDTYLFQLDTSLNNQRYV